MTYFGSDQSYALHPIRRLAATNEAASAVRQSNASTNALVDGQAGKPVAKTGRRAKAYLTDTDYYRIWQQISHDVRSSICVISEFSEMIRDGLLPIEPNQPRCPLRVINARADEIQLLMDTALYIGQLATRDMECNIGEMDVDELLSNPRLRFVERSATRQVDYQLQCPAHMPTVRCDAGRTQYILIALWYTVIRVVAPEGALTLEVMFDSSLQQIRFRFGSPQLLTQPPHVADIDSVLREARRSDGCKNLDLPLATAQGLAHDMGGVVAAFRGRHEVCGLELRLPVATGSTIGGSTHL